MKDVLFALSNLLHYLNGPEDTAAQERRIAELVAAVKRAPGPRVGRLAEVLAILAVDAAP